MAHIFTKNKADQIKESIEQYNLNNQYLFIIGGDGTYLYALSSFKYGDIPNVYAFNGGNVGFLLPFQKENFEVVLGKIISNKLNFIFRSRMNIISHNILVCNELVVRSKEFKLNLFKIKIDYQEIELRASEVVIASSDGSTGYSLSLGGPIVFSKSVIINCSGPNRCLFRPIVVSSDCEIKVSCEGCSGWADGTEIKGNSFTVCKGDKYKVFVDDDYNQYRKISDIFSSGTWK